VKIKYYPVATASSLMAYMQRLRAVGYTPDLMIVDYADYLKPSERTKADHSDLGVVYKDLRALAGELQIGCWTASQTQRSSIQDEVIEADKVSDSFSKIMISDFVMSVSRRLQDKLVNGGRAHVIKNRFGKDGLTFPMRMDLEHGIIDMLDDFDDPNSPVVAPGNDKGSGDLLSKLHQKFMKQKPSCS
jgi:hypothetical protein